MATFFEYGHDLDMKKQGARENGELFPGACLKMAI